MTTYDKYSTCLECECIAGFSTDDLTNPLIGDGVCNDQINNLECDFDGGDCCLSCIDTFQCSPNNFNVKDVKDKE